MNIAIDGPGGSGKSTIAKILAKKLHFAYLNTEVPNTTEAFSCLLIILLA